MKVSPYFCIFSAYFLHIFTYFCTFQNCISLSLEHIDQNIAYSDIFCIFPYLTCRLIVVQLLVTLRTTNDPILSPKHCPHLNILPLNIFPYPPAVPSHADLDMRKVKLAAGGPNYETVLHDADIQMGPESQIIPSERCGGQARQANLKQKARYITRSVAETLHTVL